MTTNNAKIGWLAHPQPRESCDLDAATRFIDAAVAKPEATGQETVIGKKTPTGLESADHTRLVSAAQPEERERPKSATYIPLAEVRKTGEVTVCWDRHSSPNSRLQARLVTGISSIWADSHRRRIVVAALVVALLGSLGWYQMRTVKTASGQPPVASLESTNQRKIAGPSTTLPPKSSAPTTAVAIPQTPTQPSPAPPTANLKTAVDKLADGRLDEALSLFRQLRANQPEENTLQLAVKILSQTDDRKKP